jgi:hypothetical protein
MKGNGPVLTTRVYDNRQDHHRLTSEAVVPNSPSTQRAPSNDNADHPGRDSEQKSAAPPEPAASASALDGLHDVEELSVEIWLHLALGLETG